MEVTSTSHAEVAIVAFLYLRRYEQNQPDTIQELREAKGSRVHCRQARSTIRRTFRNSLRSIRRRELGGSSRDYRERSHHTDHPAPSITSRRSDGSVAATWNL